MLYPIKFTPILKERVWGGKKLNQIYNKQCSENKTIGESWEISGLQGDISVVSNGFLEGNNLEEIIEVYMGDLVGDAVYEKFGNEFPLLIKLLDTQENLSVQVHPDDNLAIKKHNAYGKTEMWYILNSEIDSRIYAGFENKVETDEYKAAVRSSSILSLLNTIKPIPEDVFFIPAGRVHAIGSNIVLAEIQQTSDITYRIYDWGRKGLDGKPRELHNDLAEEAIDYSASIDHLRRIKPENNIAVNLIECKYFTTNVIKFDSDLRRDYFSIDSFIIYICTDGYFNIAWDTNELRVEKGETVLIPASLDDITLKSDMASILEIYIDEKQLNE